MKKCKDCGLDIRLRDFHSNTSIEVWKNTGFCQDCQSKVDPTYTFRVEPYKIPSRQIDFFNMF